MSATDAPRTVAETARALSGLPFVKMTGSGNDFVVLDARDLRGTDITAPEVIACICNRNNGIGADGVVVIEPGTAPVDVRIRYFNRDGTAGDLCGNATLCSTALSAQLGLGAASGMRLATGAGVVTSRVTGGVPEIDLQPVRDVRLGVPVALEVDEGPVGYAMVGVPHLVIVCRDADGVGLAARGPALRCHDALGPAGANVNWVSVLPNGRWRYRTFERGVEGETLACGTGAVATAVLLASWGLAVGPQVLLQTSSGRDVTVLLRPALSDVAEGSSEAFQPTLRGEGRVVFRGTIGTLEIDHTP